MDAPAEAALLFPLLGPNSDPAAGMLTLVDAGVCEVRRVAVGPAEVHGPARCGGDAGVLVLAGSVAFTVDGRPHIVAAGDLLWVRGGTVRGFVGGDGGAVLLAVRVRGGAEGEPDRSGTPGPEDRAVIAGVAAHHADMSARLDRRAAAVAQPGDAAVLASSLPALVGYLRSEVLPHAAAEEETFYAEARQQAGGTALVDALVMEHEDLRSRAQALAQISGAVAGAGSPDGSGRPGLRGDLWVRAAGEAAAIAALFRIHARKEDEIVLPALVAAGVRLQPILERMERAFSTAGGGG